MILIAAIGAALVGAGLAAGTTFLWIAGLVMLVGGGLGMLVDYGVGNG